MRRARVEVRWGARRCAVRARGRTATKKKKFLRRSHLIKYVDKRTGSYNEKVHRKNLEEYWMIDLDRKFINDDQRLPQPSEEEVMKIMKDLDHNEVNDQ